MSDSGNKLSKCLTALEEMTPTNKICPKHFEPLISAINKSENMEPTEIQRILKIFTHCANEDIVNLPYALKAVTTMFIKTKSSLLLSIQDYLPSALSILHMVKTEWVSPDEKGIRSMSFNTLLAYPVDVLVAIVAYNCSELLEIFTVYGRNSGYKFGEDACYFLTKLINILPSEQRSQFVKGGLTIWFRDLIPKLMEVVQEDNTEQQLVYLECVEVMLNDLLHIDYSKCLHWQYEVFRSICQMGEYPDVIKKLLKKNSNIWHRLWIILVKLLKNEITSYVGAYGTPINSMLPVVEMAFKMDAQNRCYAFQCWEVLIERCALEPSTSSFSKKIKLLLIPLKSNNSKTTSTTLAKFNCWWKIIYVFNVKLDKFLSDVLLDFISFAFGQNSTQSTSKSTSGMAEINPCLRQKCIEVYANIIGHANNCKCQTSLSPMPTEIMSSKLLIAHWNDWMFALKEAIRLSAFDYKPNSVELNANCLPVVCVWRQFATTLAALPDNATRRDLFSGLIQVLLDLCKECSANTELPELLLSLAVDLFDVEDVIELITNDTEDPPIQKIINIVMNPDLNKFYERCDLKVLKEMLKPMLCEAVMIYGLFNKKSAKTKSALKIWTVLVDLLIETEIDLAPPIANMLFLWPLEALCIVELDKNAALVWYKLYSTVEIKLNMEKFEEEYLSCLKYPSTDASDNTDHFRLCMTIALLKYKLRNGQDSTFVASVFRNLTSKIYDYQEYEQVLPASIDATVLLINNVIHTTDEECAKLAFDCAKNLVKIIISGISLRDNNSIKCDPIDDNVLIMAENLFRSFKHILEIPTLYTEANIEFVKKLHKHLTNLNNPSNYLKLIKELESLLKSKIEEKIDKSISQTIITCKVEECDLIGNTKENANLFAIPSPKKPNKNAQKNMASIVNTVVENGDEYVVVESNWKFNPRKLTEAQKEKLERRRDIPTLYSQSQDEFNLSTWKTDSQDTTTSSNSKSVNIQNSSTTYNATSDLLNIASADVIPKIMENILSNSSTLSSASKSNKTATSSLETEGDNNRLIIEKKATPKSTRSPRMSLKDRVSRSLGMLMIKSNPNNDSKRNSVDRPEILEIILTEKDNVPAAAPSSTLKSNETFTSCEADSGSHLNTKNQAAPVKTKSSQISPKDHISENERIFTPQKEDISLSKEHTSTLTSVLKSNDTSLETDSEKKNHNAGKKIISKSINSRRMSLNGQKSENVKKFQSQCNNNSQEKMIDEVPKLAVPTTQEEENHENLDISASSSLSADRPSRMKRKPKKFEDVQLFGLKRRRYSCGYRSDSSDRDVNSTKKNKDNNAIDDINSHDSQEKTKKNEKQKEFIVQEVRNVSHSNVPNLIDKSSAPEDIHETPINVISSEPHSKESDDNENRRKRDSSIEKISHPNAPNLIQSHNPIDETSTLFLEHVDETQNNVISNTPHNVTGNDNPENIKVTSEWLPDSDHAHLTDKINSQSVENNNHNETNSIQMPNDIKTKTTLVSTSKTPSQKSSSKKNKKSRIESQLAIDTVEGHPLLNLQSRNRSTRNNLADSNQSKRKSVTEKLNDVKTSPNANKKYTKKLKSSTINSVADTQEKNSLDDNFVNDSPPCSEDFIESSQDSSLTTISLKSTRRTPKRVNNLKGQKEASSKLNVNSHTQDLLQDSDCVIISQERKSQIHENKDDIELPQNKTAEMNRNESAFTENMDTEPIIDRVSVEDFALTNDNCLEATNDMPITINSENTVEPESQALAEADTQPNNPSEFDEMQCTPHNNKEIQNSTTNIPEIVSSVTVVPISQENDTQMISEQITDTVPDKGAEVLSSFNDEPQRKQDFLNNTSEISPIKVQRPNCDDTISVPEETSNDYVVIELSTPVQSNGEPFDKSDSPEIFTDDKVSPDKRDQSPPRTEVSVNSSSPSSMLSLKKNKPQVRGRGAHMLGLCVPDSLNTIKNLEISESDETKKATTSTPARKNLRMFYNASEHNNNTNEQDDNFLNFKKSLPLSNSSPSVPILKRKLSHIADDAQMSPASKRKRVSFHDPPVSTTVSVQKYIEPGVLRSPSSSRKRMDRPLTRTFTRSPRRLQNCSVKLVDALLFNAAQSFTESLTNDLNSSMEVTPAVQIVKSSELNDADPICSELVDCKDSIENVAVELSSPAMKDLFIKELAGKVDTVGDLARMTELEVNRLCIKAPKVEIAKKVLNDYATKRTIDTDDAVVSKEINEQTIETEKAKSIAIQEETVMCENGVQTEINLAAGFTQTEVLTTSDIDSQTTESSFMTTSDVITACLSEREDFVDKFIEKLDDATLRRFAEKMSTEALVDLLATRSEDFKSFDFKTIAHILLSAIKERK